MPTEVWTHLCVTWKTIQDEIPEKNADFPAKDEEFHESLAQATGNQSLVRTIRSINLHLHFKGKINPNKWMTYSLATIKVGRLCCSAQRT